MKKHPTPTRRQSVGKRAPAVIALLRAALFTLGGTVAVLLLLCACLCGTEDPVPIACTAASILPMPAALVCGMLSAAQHGQSGLLCGLGGGAVFCLALFCLGLSVPAGETVTRLISPAVTTAVCVVLSGLGGYAVTHKKPKARKHHS